MEPNLKCGTILEYSKRLNSFFFPIAFDLSSGLAYPIISLTMRLLLNRHSPLLQWEVFWLTSKERKNKQDQT